MKGISKTIWTLSIVSLFTDAASEMLFPIMPLYLKSIGFSIILIGILEGCAEAISGLSKGYFGELSDFTKKRVVFVRAGYSLSAIAKPLMAIFIQPLWVFFVRCVERMGKGIRTGARDAMLSDEATLDTKGKIFGFHRSMDTFGAVIGPSIALLYLHFHPNDYRSLFLLAFIPGCFAIAATFMLKDKTQTKEIPDLKRIKSISFLDFVDYWKRSSPTYKKVVAGLLAFALMNSSDVFILLKAKQSGLSDMQVVGTYIFYNLIYALSALEIGILADKFGLRNMFITGLFIFAIVYVGMSFQTGLPSFILLLFLYGIYAAATEGVSKAWISNISLSSETATAIGTYSGFQTVCTLLASSITGFIWFRFGADIAFMITGVWTALIALYFIYLKL